MEGSQGFLGFKLEPEILSEDFSYFSWWRTLCSEHRGEVPGPVHSELSRRVGTAPPDFPPVVLSLHRGHWRCELTRSQDPVISVRCHKSMGSNRDALPLYLLVGVGRGSKSGMAAAALGEPETMRESLRRTWVSGIGSSHPREPSAGAW